MRHNVDWNTASPLWEEALKDSTNQRFRQPVLLRFDSDGFMEELQELVRTDPGRLREVVARAETRRDPGAGWLPQNPPANSQPLRLYQPSQQRFYLVAASLNCRLPGLPERKVDGAVEEKVSFVLRRLGSSQPGQQVDPADASTFVELGWVAEGEKKGWAPLMDGSLLEGEERLPLFPMQFNQADRQRRIWAGLVPVSSRETYQAAGAGPLTVSSQDLSGDPLADPRLAEFQTQVSEALTQLQVQIDDNAAQITDQEAREIFLFALLDLAEFLQQHLKDAWKAVLENGWSGPANSQKPVFDHLRSLAFKTGIQWDDALRQVWGQRQDILDGNDNAAFVSDGLNNMHIRSRIHALQAGDSDFSNPASFNSLVKDALGPFVAPADAADPPEVPKFDPDGGDLYRIRCLYERPRCRGIQAPALSAPTRVFQLAGFFDSDAPARPVRIAFPVDTSIAGLRKFPKNVSMLISNQLRQQMDRVEGVKLEDLDSGDVPTGPDRSLGMICSLSIPIISICAMILLMIIVQLLNIVFWWLPFFRICLPLNLKSK